MSEMDSNVLREVGSSGVVRFGGFVFEEFLRELQGPKGMAVYREMKDNDPTIGGALFAFDQLIRKVDWRMDPAGRDSEMLAAAEFVKGCMDDMSFTWADTISEIMTMVPFGWAWHEVVYKQRLGMDPGKDDEGEPLPTSKFDDGLLGWRKLPGRAQETLWQWEFGKGGSIKGMVQRAAPEYNTVLIPIERSLLFRHVAHKNNPEGRSALRNSYRSWYFKKKLEVIEAIGIERELAGLPVAKIPPEYLMPTATPAQKALLQIFKDIVTNVRNDEQGGIVWPLKYDEKGNELFKLELLSTQGRRGIDTNVVINRYDQKMAQTLLADLIMIGNSGKGSFALMESKVDLFTQAIEGWLDSICEVFNKHAIPRLMAVNGMDSSLCPKLAHGSVDSMDLQAIADFVTSLGGAGFLTPQPGDESYFRQIAKMPIPQDGEDMTAGN